MATMVRGILVGWMKNKFDIDLDVEDLRAREADDIRSELTKTAEIAYRRKESEYPVLAGITKFGRPAGNNQYHLDKDSLVAWAKSRFNTDISDEEMTTEMLGDVRNRLIDVVKSITRPAKTRCRS